MAKVFGLHMIRLREGVNEAEVEKFMAEELPKLTGSGEGRDWYFLKGVKGDREGMYAVLYEAESVEAYKSGEFNRPSEAQQAVYAQFMEKWAEFSGSDWNDNTIFTDYVELAKTG